MGYGYKLIYYYVAGNIELRGPHAARRSNVTCRSTRYYVTERLYSAFSGETLWVSSGKPTYVKAYDNPQDGADWGETPFRYPVNKCMVIKALYPIMEWLGYSLPQQWGQSVRMTISKKVPAALLQLQNHFPHTYRIVVKYSSTSFRKG